MCLHFKEKAKVGHEMLIAIFKKTGRGQMNMCLLDFRHFCEVIHEHFLAGLITAYPPEHSQAYTWTLDKLPLPSILRSHYSERNYLYYAYTESLPSFYSENYR